MEENKKRKAALTTVDNPYDPFEEFDKWYQYDISRGYGTAEYLARVTRIAEGLSEAVNDYAIEEAIDEIISINSDKFYKKVVREY